MSRKSIYKPINEDKVISTGHPLYCRSSWEHWLCGFLDRNANVLKWSLEPFAVPYISPKDARPHRYYPDAYVEMADGKKLLVEVKPFAQTVEPVPPKRRTGPSLRRYHGALATWAINQAKWRAAKEFCLENGLEFHVFTELTLQELGMKFSGGSK